MNFKIYQIKDVVNCPYTFRDYECAKKCHMVIEDYSLVYEFTEATLLMSQEDLAKANDEVLLEHIFRLFNRVTKEDVERLDFIGFKGHSLSTSDIVSIDGRVYYCDSFGWKLVD